MKHAVQFAIQTPDVNKSVNALPADAAIRIGEDIPVIDKITTFESKEGLTGMLRFEKEEEAAAFVEQLKKEHASGFGYIETHDCHHSSTDENKPCENVIRVWVNDEEKEADFEVAEQEKVWENPEAVDPDKVEPIELTPAEGSVVEEGTIIK